MVNSAADSTEKKLICFFRKKSTSSKAASRALWVPRHCSWWTKTKLKSIWGKRLRLCWSVRWRVSSFSTSSLRSATAMRRKRKQCRFMMSKNKHLDPRKVSTRSPSQRVSWRKSMDRLNWHFSPRRKSDPIQYQAYLSHIKTPESLVNWCQHTNVDCIFSWFRSRSPSEPYRWVCLVSWVVYRDIGTYSDTSESWSYQTLWWTDRFIPVAGYNCYYLTSSMQSKCPIIDPILQISKLSSRSSCESESDR